MVQSKIAHSIPVEVEKPVLQSYFSTLNQGQFDLTAALFSDRGKLIPPFDTPVIGQQSIADYLKQEAVDMHFQPRTSTSQLLPNGQTNVDVRGQVSTSVFKINVAWKFLLSEREEIDLVKVNLLASMQELLHLRPQTKQKN